MRKSKMQEILQSILEKEDTEYKEPTESEWNKIERKFSWRYL